MTRASAQKQDGPQLDFCILGGSKSGKTALKGYLRTHPQVFLTETESSFYADDIAEYRLDIQAIDRQAYCELFAGAAEGQLLGQMSGSYLLSARAVPNILKDNPNARFIVMLRNPVDMAHSLHSDLFRRHYEDESSLQKAWELQDARAADKRILAGWKKPKLLLYRERCSFAAQIERLFERVQRERLLVHVYEEFFADLRGSYLHTLAFLGLPDDGRRNFERIEEHAIPRSWLLNRLLYRPPFPLNRLYPSLKRALNAFGLRPFAAAVRANRRTEKFASLDASFRRQLEAEFRPDVARLEAILGRSIDVWRSS